MNRRPDGHRDGIHHHHHPTENVDDTDPYAHFLLKKGRQTREEVAYDRKRMKTLKYNIEKDIPNTTVHVDECTSWCSIWRIPITFQQTYVSIRDSHFKIVQSHGAELCVMEIFSQEQTHECIVELKKSTFRFRGWTSMDWNLFLGSILMALYSGYQLINYVQPIYQQFMG